MPIFNSLGSNYSWREVLLSGRQIFAARPTAAQKNITNQLGAYFDGQAVLLFNGRDALEYCLQAYGIGRNDQVLTQAFSCSSIEEAIKRVGAQACYFDLAPGKLRVSLEQIKQAANQANQRQLGQTELEPADAEQTKPNQAKPNQVKLNQRQPNQAQPNQIKPSPQPGRLKAVILQHTLGYPDEVSRIYKYCQENKILLIADLAQAVGAVDQQRQPISQQADAVILSFGRDKILDAVIGGAVIFKNQVKSLPPLKTGRSFNKTTQKQLRALTFYPFLTWLIRHTYSLGLGKMLHWLLKRTNLLSTSIKSPHHHYQPYPARFSKLLLDRWLKLETQLDHRRKIAYYYFNRLHRLQKIKLPINRNDIKRGTNLRLPLLISSRQEVQPMLKFLATQGIHLSDRWYRRPVDSGSTDFNSSYQPGSCPQAEKTAQTIINLPTHQNISLKQAGKIVDLIHHYLEYKSAH